MFSNLSPCPLPFNKGRGNYGFRRGVSPFGFPHYCEMVTKGVQEGRSPSKTPFKESQREAKPPLYN